MINCKYLELKAAFLAKLPAPVRDSVADELIGASGPAVGVMHKRKDNKHKGKPKQRKYKKYKNEMQESVLLRRWPMVLNLQVKFPFPGEASALVKKRKM